MYRYMQFCNIICYVKIIFINYLELEFEYVVYLIKIEIWEIYNLGIIVRILVCDSLGIDVDRGMIR